jgi:uncharacterized protein with HEPN domain
MPPRDWTLRIQDILSAIERINQYTESMAYAAFCIDQKTIDAVIRNFTIVGEAVRAVPEHIANAHDEIPWRDMGDMRNLIVHSYHRVDLEVIWDTIQNDLPDLVEPLEKLLLDETKH